MRWSGPREGVMPTLGRNGKQHTRHKRHTRHIHRSHLRLPFRPHRHGTRLISRTCSRQLSSLGRQRPRSSPAPPHGITGSSGPHAGAPPPAGLAGARARVYRFVRCSSSRWRALLVPVLVQGRRRRLGSPARARVYRFVRCLNSRWRALLMLVQVEERDNACLCVCSVSA